MNEESNNNDPSKAVADSPETFLKEFSSKQKPAYLVVSQGYCYNDDWYYIGEENSPIKVFETMEQAFQHCEKMNAAEFRKTNFLRFEYYDVFYRKAKESYPNKSRGELKGVVDVERKKAFSKILGSDFDFNVGGAVTDSPFGENVTDEQLAKIAELLEMHFFEVVEIQVNS